MSIAKLRILEEVMTIISLKNLIAYENIWMVSPIFNWVLEESLTEVEFYENEEFECDSSQKQINFEKAQTPSVLMSQRNYHFNH